MWPAPGTATQFPAPDTTQESAPDSNESENDGAAAAPASSDRMLARPLRTMTPASGGFDRVPFHAAANSANEGPAALTGPSAAFVRWSACHTAAVLLATVSPGSPAGSCRSHRAEATCPAEPGANADERDGERTFHLAASRSAGWRWPWYWIVGSPSTRAGKKCAQPSDHAQEGLAVRPIGAAQAAPPDPAGAASG